MAFFNGWPFTQFQEQNLDWLINQVKTLAQQMPELQQNFDDLKAYVENYFAELNVEAELRDVIQEMIDDGTLLTLIMSYVNMDYVTPDQYKTSINTWDQAFAAAFASGKKVLIPNKTYTINEPYVVPEDMIIADEGTYTNQKVIITKSDPTLFSRFKSEYVHKDYAAVDGYTTSNGTQGWCWNSTKSCWAHMTVLQGTDLYLVETSADLFDDTATLIQAGGYPTMHAGSITYCPENNLYYIAGLLTNQIWAVDPVSYSRTVIVLPTNPADDIELFTWDPDNKIFYAFSQSGQCIHVLDQSYTLLKTYAYTSNNTKIASLMPWASGLYTYKQEPAVINGSLYMLYSVWPNDTESGFAVTYLDLYHDKEYVVYSERYNFPGHQIEAQGFAYNGKDILIIGSYTAVNLIFSYGTKKSNNILPSGSSTIFVYIDTDNTTHSNGDGTSAYPFTVSDAAEYFSAFRYTRIVLNSLSRPITLRGFFGQLWIPITDATKISAKITIEDSKCQIVTGGTIREIDEIEINNSIVLMDSCYIHCHANVPILITNGSHVNVRNCHFTTSDAGIMRVVNNALLQICASDTNSTYLAWVLNRGVAIDAGGNTAVTNVFNPDASGRVI